MAHLFRVILPVSDIERAQRFYSVVLGSSGTRVSPGRHYFDCDGTILACFDPLADGDAHPPTPIPEPIYLAVADLRAAFEACRAAGASFSEASPPGVGPLGSIAERAWGETSFYVTDPFGNPSACAPLYGNKALQLTRRRRSACQALQPSAARFGGRFVGRPPVEAFSSTAARS